MMQKSLFSTQTLCKRAIDAADLKWIIQLNFQLQSSKDHTYVFIGFHKALASLSSVGARFIDVFQNLKQMRSTDTGSDLREDTGSAVASGFWQ
jgi:hypothetical protein